MPAASSHRTDIRASSPETAAQHTQDDRTILKNAGGEEKSVDELRQLIRTTYGIEPAKSLEQMLYRRASASRGFDKTKEGKFGLTELGKGVAITCRCLQPPLSKLRQVSGLAMLS